MMGNKPAFYFANLGADIQRCAIAAEDGNEQEYARSLERAFHTLSLLEKENRPEAYEEGLLLLRGLEYARASGMNSGFRRQVDQVIAPFAARLAVV